MALNLSELREGVRNILNAPESVQAEDSGVSDADVTRAINYAQEQLCKLLTFPEMRFTFDAATVVGEAWYGFPERTKELFSLVAVRGTRHKELVFKTPATFNAEVGNRALSGFPSLFLDYGDELRLHPIPDDTYALVLQASTYVPDLSLDSDESELYRKDEAIVVKAAELLLYDLREFEAATQLSAVRFQRVIGLEGKVQSEKAYYAPAMKSGGSGWGRQPKSPWAGRK